MAFERDAAPFLIPSSKPQLHSRKCHHTYNATRSLPIAVWIRSLRFGVDLGASKRNHSSNASDDGSDDDDEEQDVLRGIPLFSNSCTVVYEIVLYYDHNRACTIYRSPEDFAKLKEAVGPAKYRKWVSQHKQSNRHAGSDSEDEDVHVNHHHHHHNGLAPIQPVVEDVEDLQRFLSKTISRKGRDCAALEYFLRRRMDDCGGQ